jgi:hypothetical protein
MHTLALSVHETPTERAFISEVVWSFPHRLAFRFATIYLVLYNFDVAIRLALGTDLLSTLYDRLWERVVPWVGGRFLHLAVPVGPPNGSGDRLFDWVQILCFAVLAWAGGLVWSVVDHRRPHYRTLLAWVRLYVRYSLGVTLLSYGAFKVFKSQFPAPAPFRLTETYGDSSPMGLLWTFMGYSTPYTIFAGGAEALAGILLLFRRTAALGALLGTVVITNVVMLNFCYDVPVKQYSSHLLAMALFLLVPVAGRLAQVLLLEQPTAPPAVVPLITGPRLATAARLLGLLFVGAALVKSGADAWQARRIWGDGAEVRPLHGAYQVAQLTSDRSTAATRWRRVGIDRRWFHVLLKDDSLVRLRVVADEPGARLVLSDPEQANRQYVLRYQLQDGGQRLILDGGLRDETVAVELRRLDTAEFPLLRRGFHWVSEVPFNR